MTDDRFQDRSEDRSEGVVALSRWRAVLARSRNPRKRLDLVMSDPQAASVVPRIPVEEFYYLVRGVGLEDTLDVLRLASAEQLQGCLDLDLWDRDRLSTPRVLAWLEVLAELSPPVLARTIQTLDIELVALVLGKHARVYDSTVGEAPDEESTYVVHRTSDAAFVVEFRTSNATDARILERFIMRLYDGDPDLARALLTEAKWGTTAELEEASYRWRTARLADIGFPSYEDALVVYREVQPARLLADSPPPILEAAEIPMLPVLSPRCSAATRCSSARSQRSTTPISSRRCRRRSSACSTGCWWRTASMRPTSTSFATRPRGPATRCRSRSITWAAVTSPARPICCRR
jgi:hypothetical protein